MYSPWFAYHRVRFSASGVSRFGMAKPLRIRSHRLPGGMAGNTRVGSRGISTTGGCASSSLSTSLPTGSGTAEDGAARPAAAAAAGDDTGTVATTAAPAGATGEAD